MGFMQLKLLCLNKGQFSLWHRMKIKMNIKNDFETKFTGSSFLLAAFLLITGWVLSPHHIGEYIVAEDFAAIGDNVWFWIWMYRIHIFGWVTMGISLFSLVSITSQSPFRVMMLPGAGMVIIGTFTLAIAAAYYYNHGAWGVGQTMGMSPTELEIFMNKLLFTNQYVTCFVRFGRIFSGVGLILLGIGFLKWKMFATGFNLFTILLGLIAMGIILFIPDNFEVYAPVFYVKVIWLMAMGGILLIHGVNLAQASVVKIMKD